MDLEAMLAEVSSSPFLSPEWIDTALALRDELIAQAPNQTQQAKVNLVVTGSPFGDGEVRACIDIEAGGPLPIPGLLEDPDATVTLDYRSALAAFVTDDPDEVSRGFLTGTLRVDGDLALVLILFSGGDTDEQAAFARYVQARLQAITDLSNGGK